MDTSKTLTLLDILRGNLPEDRLEEAVGVLKRFVRKEVKSETTNLVEDRVELHVEKGLLAKAQDLATKGDVLVLKSDIQKIEGRVDRLDDKMQSQFRWLMGGPISVLLADRILIIPPAARLVTLPSPKSPAATLIFAALA